MKDGNQSNGVLTSRVFQANSNDKVNNVIIESAKSIIKGKIPDRF